MNKINTQISESLAYLNKAVSDIRYDSDLVQLKFCLKEVQQHTERAHELVRQQIDSRRPPLKNPEVIK